MDLTQHEAMELLKEHRVVISCDDHRSLEDIAMQLLELGKIAIEQTTQEHI